MQPAPDKEPKKQEQPHPERQEQPPQPEMSLLDMFMTPAEPKEQEQPQFQPEDATDLNAFLRRANATDLDAFFRRVHALSKLEQSLPVIKPGYIRQIIDFPPSTAKALRELAKGGSIGDTLRDAIALSKWFKDTREEGGRILVERNGKVHEVITIKYPSER